MLAASTIAAYGCSGTSTGPELPPLEVVVAGGDGQYGTAGIQLPVPLRVVVRGAESKEPEADVSVRWSVTGGDASLVGPDARVTDDAGAAEILLRLGSSLGEVTVQATVVEQPSASASLRAFLVGPPSLRTVQPGSVSAGGTVVLEGENFSPVPDQNSVFFSGIRGRVTAAAATRLEVSVPSCLPARAAVGVRVALGIVSSDSLSLEITQAGPLESLEVGGVLDLDDPAGLECLLLSGAGGAEYLAVAYSAGTVAAALHPFAVTGLSAGPGVEGPVLAPTGLATPEVPGTSAQEDLDARLRLEEADLLEGREVGEREVGVSGRAPAGPAAVPAAGTKRTFYVYNGSDDPEDRFDVVTATARYVGQEAVVYVDDAAPEPGFTDADLQGMAGRFDQVIHRTVTDAFGSVSDLDGNDRVAILFTPVVNGLTERGSTSFVGGFFYGRDLLPELPSSNVGEVFYSLVPDPAALYGDARDRQQLLEVVPAILAHEFMHMVHFNQRVLLLDATQDALWMQEGLAQMAEELVARAYEEGGASSDVVLFREGNRRRARLYLGAPDTVSLIVSSGGGTLAERGAGFLFLLYLLQQEDGDILSRMVRTLRTGVANVEAATGTTWERLLPDWWAATHLDGAVGVPGPLTYPGFDLRDFLGLPSPLVPQPVGGSDFRISGALPSSGARFFLLEPPSGGSVSVGFGGAGGGAPSQGAALGLRIVRTR